MMKDEWREKRIKDAKNLPERTAEELKYKQDMLELVEREYGGFDKPPRIVRLPADPYAKNP